MLTEAFPLNQSLVCRFRQLLTLNFKMEAKSIFVVVEILIIIFLILVNIIHT